MNIREIWESEKVKKFKGDKTKQKIIHKESNSFFLAGNIHFLLSYIRENLVFVFKGQAGGKA